METPIIRAKTPKGFDYKIHQVVKFKRYNYDSFYLLQPNGYYRYQGISAESSISYSENALLGLSRIIVDEFRIKM